MTEVNIPEDSATLTWLRTLSPARRQELDERIELAMMEAMKREATASITIQIGIVPNLEQERADLTTSFDVKLPKITGGSAVVSVFAPTGKISVFGEKVTKKGGGRLAGEGRLTSIS
mgnify:CR=1 FL=1